MIPEVLNHPCAVSGDEQVSICSHFKIPSEIARIFGPNETTCHRGS